MYILTDTFNNREISRHRTLAAAVIARMKHLKAVRKANGGNSYLTYGFSRTDGKEIEEMELLKAEQYD